VEPAGRFILEDDKTYWFPRSQSGLDPGKEVSFNQAFSTLEDILGREPNQFETLLLLSQPRGTRDISIITTLVVDPSESNFLKAVKRIPIGYLVRGREHGRYHNFGDKIGVDTFYSISGKILGKQQFYYNSRLD
jgi:hypothetical protein